MKANFAFEITISFLYQTIMLKKGLCFLAAGSQTTKKK